MLTLACFRSVPVLAETSVIVAAAMGIPTLRIFRATVLPNFVVATIYSVAADDSFATAVLAFLLTMVLSYVVWRFAPPRRKPAPRLKSARFPAGKFGTAPRGRGAPISIHFDQVRDDSVVPPGAAACLPVARLVRLWRGFPTAEEPSADRIWRLGNRPPLVALRLRSRP